MPYTDGHIQEHRPSVTPLGWHSKSEGELEKNQQILTPYSSHQITLSYAKVINSVQCKTQNVLL